MAGEAALAAGEQALAEERCGPYLCILFRSTCLYSCLLFRSTLQIDTSAHTPTFVAFLIHFTVRRVLGGYSARPTRWGSVGPHCLEQVG